MPSSTHSGIAKLAVLTVAYLFLVGSAALAWPYPGWLAALLAIEAGILLTHLRSRNILIAFVVGGILGTVGEVAAVTSGAWGYSQSADLIPYWIPLAWGITGLLITRFTSVIAETAEWQIRRSTAEPSHAAYRGISEHVYQARIDEACEGTPAPVRLKPPNSMAPPNLEKTLTANRADEFKVRAEILTEIMREKAEEVNVLSLNIVRTIGLFLAVTGALLKFAFDINATAELRLSLSTMGVIISLLLTMTCCLGENYRRSLMTDLNTLRALLLEGHPQEVLPGIRNSIFAALALACAALLGWTYLIIQQR